MQLGTQETPSSRILRATAVIGTSNAIAALIMIVRMKVFAICLGPSGMGLLGLYHSLMTTVATVSGMGIGSSGVRQVAAANGDEVRTANTLCALRLTTIVLGTIGALSLFILRHPLSTWTFGESEDTASLALLSLGVLFVIIHQSQMSILNGLRRLVDLARINVIGFGVGTIGTIVLIWSLGESGVVYSIVASVLIMLICSSWFLRGVPRPTQKPSRSGTKTEVLSLLRLGCAFVGAGLMMAGALLFTRIIFRELLGLHAAGQFQAAWGVAVSNIDFILAAMSTDFYPHLSDCIKRDRLASHRLVNEQTKVALLLGAPLIMGMLILAGPLIRILYSAEFAPATDLLRWLLIGSILKIVSWPMGYLIMAHAWAKISLFTEVVWASSYVGLVYLGCPYFGVGSAGYAFFMSYLILTVVLYCITRRCAGFVWSRTNVKLIAAVVTAGIVVALLTSREDLGGYLVGGLITAVFGVLSIAALYTMSDEARATRIMQSMRKTLLPIPR